MQLQAYQDGSGCELSLARRPVPEDGTIPPIYFKPSMFWCVAETSQVKDAAAQFINSLHQRYRLL